VGLNAEESQALLQEVPRNYRVRIQEVLTTALVRSMSRWNGGKGLLMDLEGHGREELPRKLDVSRTVGWFTTLYPVYVQLEMKGLGEDLKAVKEQLRRVPGHGLGYGVLRYLDREERLRDVPQAEVVLNYLGQFDQLMGDGSWRVAEEGAGAERGRVERRPYLLEINSYIGNRCLQIDWSYSKAVHREETMQTLAAEYVKEIRELIAYCCATEGGQTPSDFPLTKISQSQLDQILLRRKKRTNPSGQGSQATLSQEARDEHK
jgi:non-ribosomal peptide synthase protein (TIGR01720 family)